MTLVKENFAKHLQKYREMYGLSLEKLAKELGVSPASLSGYLKGCVDPRIGTIGQVAEKCGMTVVEMISGLPSGWEQAKIILCAAAVFSRLSPERREKGMHLFHVLVEFLSENSSKT